MRATPAIMEPSTDGKRWRNRRTVWSVPTEPLPEAHFATFPPSLVRPCILAGSEPGDAVLDPFLGSGTVGVVCHDVGRSFVGVELNPDYAAIAAARTGVAVAAILRLGRRGVCQRLYPWLSA